jgi:hypothetical protein
MPSFIRIHGSPAGPGEVCVEKAFLSVGSGPTCEVRIPGDSLPATAASIRFRDGQFVFFNQHAAGASLNGAPAGLGTSTVWPAGARVRLADGVELELVVDGDPSPMRRPIFVPPVEPPPPVAAGDAFDVAGRFASSAAPADVARSSTPKRRPAPIQAIVTGVCLLGFLAVVVAGVMQGRTTTDTKSLDQFNTLVDQGLDDGELNAAEPPVQSSLVRRLQEAESAYRQGAFPIAAARFDRLKSYVVGRLDPAADPPPNERQKAYLKKLQAFVESRLSTVPRGKSAT